MRAGIAQRNAVILLIIITTITVISLSHHQLIYANK
jgi:hypothetical protein